METESQTCVKDNQEEIDTGIEVYLRDGPPIIGVTK